MNKQTVQVQPHDIKQDQSTDHNGPLQINSGGSRSQAHLPKDTGNEQIQEINDIAIAQKNVRGERSVNNKNAKKMVFNTSKLSKGQHIIDKLMNKLSFSKKPQKDQKQQRMVSAENYDEKNSKTTMNISATSTASQSQQPRQKQFQNQVDSIQSQRIIIDSCKQGYKQQPQIVQQNSQKGSELTIPSSLRTRSVASSRHPTASHQAYPCANQAYQHAPQTVDPKLQSRENNGSSIFNQRKTPQPWVGGTSNQTGDVNTTTCSMTNTELLTPGLATSSGGLDFQGKKRAFNRATVKLQSLDHEASKQKINQLVQQNKDQLMIKHNQIQQNKLDKVAGKHELWNQAILDDQQVIIDVKMKKKNFEAAKINQLIKQNTLPTDVKKHNFIPAYVDEQQANDKSSDFDSNNIELSKLRSSYGVLQDQNQNDMNYYDSNETQLMQQHHHQPASIVKTAMNTRQELDSDEQIEKVTQDIRRSQNDAKISSTLEKAQVLNRSANQQQKQSLNQRRIQVVCQNKTSDEPPPHQQEQTNQFNILEDIEEDQQLIVQQNKKQVTTSQDKENVRQQPTPTKKPIIPQQTNYRKNVKQAQKTNNIGTANTKQRMDPQRKAISMPATQFARSSTAQVSKNKKPENIGKEQSPTVAKRQQIMNQTNFQFKKQQTQKQSIMSKTGTDYFKSNNSNANKTVKNNIDPESNKQQVKTIKQDQQKVNQRKISIDEQQQKVENSYNGRAAKVDLEIKEPKACCQGKHMNETPKRTDFLRKSSIAPKVPETVIVEEEGPTQEQLDAEALKRIQKWWLFLRTQYHSKFEKKVRKNAVLWIKLAKIRQNMARLSLNKLVVIYREAKEAREKAEARERLRQRLAENYKQLRNNHKFDALMKKNLRISINKRHRAMMKKILMIQRVTRGFLARIRFRAAIAKVIKVQKLLRGINTRKQVAGDLREYRAAKKIQRYQKTKLQRQKFLAIQKATIKIQCKVRQLKARKLYLKLKKQKEEQFMLSNKSAAVQAKRRQLEMRKKMKAAVLVIERERYRQLHRRELRLLRQYLKNLPFECRSLYFKFVDVKRSTNILITDFVNYMTDLHKQSNQDEGFELRYAE